MHARTWVSAFLVVSIASLSASPLGAQSHRPVELGVDATATFGVGDQSSVSLVLPAALFRAGWFLDNKWSIEPAVGFSWNKVEGVDGILTYDIQVGALYHLVPFLTMKTGETAALARVWSPYVRPFMGFTGFTDGGSDNEFSLGAGFGLERLDGRFRRAVRGEYRIWIQQ